MEIYKDVIGYEGVYQVSNIGNVKSLKRKASYLQGDTGRLCYRTVRERVLKPSTTKDGYKFVVLCSETKEIKRKGKKVHQLIAESFLDHIPNGNTIVVDHINSIKDDNRLENLRLVTQRENTSKDTINVTGFTGAYNHKGKFRAAIQVKGKRKHLGTFDTAQEAHNAYLKAIPCQP